MPTTNCSPGSGAAEDGIALQKGQDSKAPFHYGWIIVATGTLVICACLGFGRFALGMLLPSMGADLGLDYTQMGFISTGNFVGYLVVVIVSGQLSRLLGARTLIVAGLAMVGLSMVGVSLARGFWGALLPYILTGFGSAAANVPIMGLVSHWFRRSLRGRAAGFIVIGSGPAIILSGWLIPFVNSQMGSGGWRASWLILGVICLVITVLALLLLRNDPADKGLSPLGEDPPPREITPSAPSAGSDRKVVLHLGALYFLFGFTYVIYATFLVTTLVAERGLSESLAGQFWMWVGAFSLLSGPVFGTLSDKIGRRLALMIVFCLQGAAYLLVAVPLPVFFLYLSIGLWGSVAWSIPSIMAAALGDFLGPAKAAAAFGTVTFFFGIGQIAGPSLAGVLADAWGSFVSSFWMAAFLAGLAALLADLLKKHG